MVLDILAGCEVAAPAAEFIGNPRQLFHLAGCEHTARDLGADHLHTRLPLPINPVFEAEGTELVFVNLACQERFGFAAKDLNFFAHGPIVLYFQLFRMDELFWKGRCHNHLLLYRDYRNSGLGARQHTRTAEGAQQRQNIRCCLETG
jgi:hypothetical protein